MKRSKFISSMLVLAGLAMVLTIGFSAFAAPTQSVTFNNPAFATVDVTSSYDFTNVQNGQTYNPNGSEATITTSSNTNWNVSLSGTDFTAEAGNVIPIGSLEVKVATADPSTYQAVPKDTTAVVATGTLGVGTNTNLDYRLTVPTDAKGTSTQFKATLTYTIANV